MTNSGVNGPRETKMLLRVLLATYGFWRSRVFISSFLNALNGSREIDERLTELAKGRRSEISSAGCG